MRIFSLLFVLLLTTFSFAQQTGDVVVFNNSGYQFHVVLNGITQNSKAESNVRIQGLEGSFYSCMIIADDNTFSIDKNIIVKPDTLISYEVVSKKGKYKLRFFSEIPMAKAPQVSQQSVVTYHTSENSGTTTTTNGTEAVQMNVGTTVSETTPTTTTQTVTSTTTITEGTTTTGTGATNGTENVSISMTAGENGIEVNMSATGLEGSENMNIEMTGTEMGSTTTYEETTTTTYSETINGTTTYSESTITTNEGNIGTSQEIEVGNSTMSTETVPTSNCYISETEAEKAIQLIQDETFADDQLIMAKTLVSKKCLNIDQVGKIADILTFEDDRLEFVKAAYHNCLNQNDYFQLLSKFTFSDNKEALKKFIEQH